MPESSDQLPIKPIERWAAIAIFLVPALAAFLDGIVSTATMSEGAGPIMVIIFLVTFIAPFIWAVIKGFPRWSPHYLGPLLLGLVFFGPFLRLVEPVYLALIPWIGPMRSWPLSVHVLYSGMLSAIIWFLVLLAAFVLVSGLRLWPHTRTLWTQVQEDWTQLSFILYGGLVFHVVLIFDSYQGNGPWKVAAWLCLGAGCWFYLRARKRKQRLIILLTGATLAMWLVAIGKWVLIPSQNWHPWIADYPSDAERWSETMGTIADWISLMIVLLSPSLLNLFPKKLKQMPQAELDSASESLALQAGDS